MNSTKFYRIDYAQVGTTSRNCLKVINASQETSGKESFRRSMKKKIDSDKIVIGGHNGILLCVDRKGGDTNIVFKTSPGLPITQVVIGGALNTVYDKTFIASGGVIKGFSKKGKQFLSFETNLTDPIGALYIYGVDMLLCGINVYYHFHDCVERSCYICPERINSVLCLPITEGGWVGRGLTPVIACDDKTLKVLNGNNVLYEVFLNDIPITLHLFMNDGGYNKQKILYGTRSGRLGLVDVQNEAGIICWDIPTKSNGGITAIKCQKITESGLSDIIIGKDDGLIEIYSVDDSDNAQFRQSYQCEESITGLDCGKINSDKTVEIVVCTYTGWVFGLTTEPIIEQLNNSTSQQVEIKVQQLRTELEELEMKAKEEREKYEELTHGNPDSLTMVPPFSVNDRFVLDEISSCYLLSIELVIPIEYIVLQSDADIELMDIARSTAVVSFTKPTPECPENKLLATYRCQADTTRIEMRIRSIEGRGGTLRAYIVPDMRPKMCQIRTYPIKPLALHERIHEFNFDRPLNNLKITGEFTIAEAHEWLTSCVSQIPDRCPSDEASFTLKSTENGGTILNALYRDNNALFKSDCVSTIVIIRDVISKISTQRKLKVNMLLDINPDSIDYTLNLIHPKMEYFAKLIKTAELAKGLKELESTFEDMPFLNTELKNILKNHDEYVREVELKRTNFDRIIGVITDLYVDKWKLQGINPKDKTNELLHMLSTDYSLEKVVQFFKIQP